MTDATAPEPTMEEILASIRRIISEDEPAAEAPAEPVAAAPPPHEPEPAALVEEPEDVLELTELAPAPAPAPVETHGDLEIHAAPELPAAVFEPPLAPSIAAPAPVYQAAPAVDEGSLLSPTSAASAASAFGQLAHTVIMPAEGRVLEDVVRELLRPLLKAWLDEHLPTIVQAKVDEEVERIARRRVG